MRACRFTASLVAVLILSGCGRQSAPPAIAVGSFDAEQAYRHVERLVALGPRPSGSDELKRASQYLGEQLRSYGLAVEEQVFHSATPLGPMQFCNVVARTAVQRGGPGRILVLGSHYDTKRMSEGGFVGANDSGSSTGVLLEIARLTSAQPNLWFVFFDGEEAIVQYGPSDGLWGSRYFVEDLQAQDRVGWIRAMVLLDMVGDASLNITIPAGSDRQLVQEVFDAARDLGYRDFFGYRPTEILDDHVPFLRAGIPAVDVVDFEFGSGPGKNDYWHTPEDALDKISPRSLEIVGQTTLQLIARLRAQPAGR